MPMESHEILRRSELFAGLPAEALARVGSRFKKTVFPAGHVICREGETGDSMFIIQRGKVAILRNMGWGERSSAPWEPTTLWARWPSFPTKPGPQR